MSNDRFMICTQDCFNTIVDCAFVKHKVTHGCRTQCEKDISRSKRRKQREGGIYTMQCQLIISIVLVAVARDKSPLRHIEERDPKIWTLYFANVMWPKYSSRNRVTAQLRSGWEASSLHQVNYSQFSHVVLFVSRDHEWWVSALSPYPYRSTSKIHMIIYLEYARLLVWFIH